MSSTPDKFDPAKHIAKYRGVIAQRDKQPEGSSRDFLEFVAQRLREEWKERQGEDTLHEMAFGEPGEQGAGKN